MSEFLRLKPLSDRLGSMNLAIILLVVVAIASMIGTVLLQNKAQVDYLEQFGPLWFWVLSLLGGFDMYHAWWFTGILVFLTVSLLVCLYRQTPRMIKEVRSRKVVIADKSLQRFHHYQKMDFSEATSGDVESKLRSIFSGWEFQTAEKDGRRYFRVDKGRANKLSYIFVHSSILIVLLGGLLSLGVGFRGNLVVVEGGTNDTIQFLKDGLPDDHQLPFVVRCNSFMIDFFSNGQPKEFRSNLTIIDNGVEVITTDIIVNEPLEYKGVRLYQASFGDGGSKLSLKLFNLDGSGRQDIVDSVVYDQLEDDSGSGISLEITDLRVFNIENMGEPGQMKEFQDLGPAIDYILRGPGIKPVKIRMFMDPFIDPMTKQEAGHVMLASFSGEDRDFQSIPLYIDLNNDIEWDLLSAYTRNLSKADPSLESTTKHFNAFADSLTEVFGEDRPDDIPALASRVQQAYATLEPIPWPFLVMLDDFEQVYYTGIQATKDPGMDIVWVGSTFLVLGLCFMFYMPHRRYWFVLEKGKFAIAGMTNKGQMGFDQEFNQTLAKVQESLGIENKMENDKEVQA